MDQALPTQFGGLEALFENMPAVAAMQVGNQQRIAEQNNVSLQEAFRQSQAHQAARRPFELEKDASELRNSQLLGDQYNAANEAARMKNDEFRRTSPNRVKSTNAELQGKISDEDLKGMERLGQVFGNVAARTGGVPPMMRASAARRLLAPYLPAQELSQIEEAMSRNPDMIPKMFQELADNHYKMSKQAREDAAKHAREIEKVNIQGQTSRDVARINAENRIDVRNLVNSGTGGKPPTMSQMEANLWMRAEQGDPAAIEQLNRLQAFREAQRAAAAGAGNQFKGDVIQGNIDNLGAAPPPRIPLPGAPKPPQGAAPPGLPQGTTANPDGTFTLPDGRIIRKKAN